MTIECKIGEEAREIDSLSIKERMKVSKGSIYKFFGAIMLYFLIMGVFSLVL